MRFDWDASNLDHIRPHKVTQQEAEQALQIRPLHVSTQERRGEVRVLALGPTEDGRLLAVVFTLRGEAVRVVTARDANRKERTKYAEKSTKPET